MKDNFNAFKENDILKNTKGAIDYVMAKSSIELELYKAGKVSNESAVNDSMRQIDNPFGSDNSMERGNQRVLTREYPGNVPNYNSQPINNMQQSNSQYYGGYNGGYSSDASSNFPNMMGSVNTLILVSIAALVILVVFVSLFIMNSGIV